MKVIDNKYIYALEKELQRQYNKFGIQTDKSILQWFAITSEEFLEINKAINDCNTVELRNEIIQTIACLLQMIERLDDYVKRD